MLGVALGSRFPMLVWWGPDLLHLYNDAYRPILRDKHPASLAAPAAEVWAEVWDVAGPLARGVMEGGPATWVEDLQLFINNGGITEETYFTFSYSPIPGDDGRVGGILNTVQETTVKVQSERQIRMLHDLAASAADSKSEIEAYRTVMQVLSGNELDLPFVLLYTRNEQGDAAELAGVSGWEYDTDAAKRTWPLAEVLQTHRELVVDDLSGRFGPLPMGRWNARPEQAIILPLSYAGQPAPRALLVAGISPHRKLDDRYRRFFRATADQVMNVIASARAYEAEKKRAEALAELDRAKTTFFSNVSHEFRTPLTLILGPLEDALARPAVSLEGDDLRAAHRNAVRLLRLVNSLLDFARIEAGRLQMSFAPTDLSRLTRELVSAFESLAERAGLKLIIDCEPALEPVYVDASLWEKIVLNLVSNAFKFTLQGEIAVTLRSNGDRVELAVRDTGSGIPARETPHIFERFHRVEGAKGRSFEGTGIGLSLVVELIRLHGGTVNVSSVEGQGSTFTVTLLKGFSHLPAERIVHDRTQTSLEAAVSPYLLEASQWIGAERSEQNTPEARFEDISEASISPRISTHTDAVVLIVDDNADMREYLKRILASRWRIDVAGDGEAALARVRINRPDLILSDVMMPRMNGYALLQELRADPTTKDIPVILLSARAGEESLLEGLETGAEDYLVKPFSARELVARVQTHLDMQHLRREWANNLERANRELEAFSYSVSHDLRAPLHRIRGFTDILLEDHAADFSGETKRLLSHVVAGAKKMDELIAGLLNLSKLGRKELAFDEIDLTQMIHEILNELQKTDPERRVRVSVVSEAKVRGDNQLIRAVMTNLLSNAWKFTAKRPDAKIEFGRTSQESRIVYYIRDNGAGFDMQYAGRLFAPFQRLHSSAQFEGTGIGLATARRVINRHGGKIWAEGAVDQGATFYFTM